MSMNFYDELCQEPPLSNEVFGLCDDKNGGKSYTDLDNPGKWIATVKNENKISIVFTAIDKCVLKDNENTGRGRCDGMLTSAEHIYFVELKDQSKGWISDAIEQLESTIQFFIENHDIHSYKHKKAFACNKRRKGFQKTDNEFNLKFFRKYNVRIDVQSDIIII